MRLEAITVIQTLLLLVTVIVGAVFVQANASVLNARVSLTIPGLPDVAVSHLQVLVGLAGLAALFWLAGMADLALLRGHVRRRDALLRVKDQEILSIKSQAFDHQQPVLADMRARLEKVSIEVSKMMTRLDAMASARPMIREELRKPALELPVRQHTAAKD